MGGLSRLEEADALIYALEQYSWATQSLHSRGVSTLAGAFRAFDNLRTGVLPQAQFRTVLSELVPAAPVEWLDALTRLAQRDSCGGIAYRYLVRDIYMLF